MDKRKTKQRKQQLGKQLLSILLAVVLTVTSMYLPADAAAVEELSSIGTDNLPVEYLETDKSTQEEETGETKILSEVVEERKKSEKTFLMSDGTFMVAQYDLPVHYEDESGQWEEIDNSLIEEDTGTEEEGYQTTEKSGIRDRIKFSKKLKEGKTVSIKNTEFPLSWGIKGARMQTVEMLQEEADEPKNWNDKFLLADTHTQTLRYAEIFDGIDAEYMVQSGGIKENIILKKPESLQEFEIVYDIGKLTPVQTDEHTIQLKNGEEIIYQICAPYMVDAQGVRSDALVLSMEQTKKKEITVTMTADENWLAEANRVYPVVIDPTILTKTTKSAIDSTFITSGQASKNYSDKFELLVGRESSSYGYCRTLIKIGLPSLKTGDMVVSAQLNMIMYATDFYSTATPDMQINAYRVTGNWAYDTVTWNNKPTYNTTVLDYVLVGQDDISNEEYVKTFDITEAVKGWYEGTYNNYGLELKMASESGSYAQNGVKAAFWPERYNDERDLYPRYTITYRNNKGLEDYWTYTTLSAGTAGTAYVNDYTGNLVFVHEDVSTTGELLPVTLQHVYNGYMKDRSYGQSYPADGRGWKLSIQQTLKSSEEYGLTGESLEVYPYAYEDGDGTVHFFYKKEEDNKIRYLDEDGLGLELTFSGNYKYITDKEDNVMTFGAKGTLLSIKDARGNQITISTTALSEGKNQITKVTDGAGHVITFTENASNHALQKITDPSGRETSYTYRYYKEDSNVVSLGKVTYPDGTCSQYYYDESGALTKAVSSDGSGLLFEYTTEAKGKRVSKVTEFGTDGSTGQSISFDRSKYNTTVIRTSGKDDIFENDDDLLTTYQFDNFGRTVGTNTKTADGVYYGGGIYTYTAGEVNASASNIKKLNRIADEAYSGKSTKNLLKNHSGESSSGWGNTYYQNSVDYSTGYDTEEKLFGQRSFRVSVTSAPSDGGGSFYQNLSTDTLVPGKTYTFSGYIRTSSVTAANDTGMGYGACLAVKFKYASGDTREYSDYVTGTTSDHFNEGWNRVSHTFTVPENTTSVQVYLLLRNATGTAYFDGLQIESGSAMNSYNMLENSSFDLQTDGKPDSWTIGNGSDGDGNSTEHWMSGGTALKLSGEAGANKSAYQRVEISGTEKDVYIASCWAWANALPDASDEAETKRPFDVMARIYYLDGTNVLKSKKAEFNRDVTGWQRASMAFDLSDGNSSTNRTPVAIRFGVRYYRQANAVYFDNAQLLKDVSDSYTYDDEGNLITAKENGDQSSALNYDDQSNLTSLTDAENNLYEYEYNDYHQVTEAKSPLGQKVLFIYESKGPVTSTTISNADGTAKIRTGNVYNAEADGIASQAYVTKTRDQNGEYTLYNRDLQSGRLNSVSTPDGTVTSYTYEEDNDLLTEVISGEKSVSYVYDTATQTRLEGIEHNDFSYGLVYDNYGNLITTSAAGNVLNSNTYAAGNGKLTETVYGNGDTKEYTYTKAGNISSESVNGTKTGGWIYDYSQQLSVYRDYVAEQEHTYSYDSTGRLLETKTFDMNETDPGKDSLLYNTLYSYDSMNRVKKKRLVTRDDTHTATYSYNKNGQPSKLNIRSTKELSYAYDTLGRLTSKNLNLTEPLKYNYQYQASEKRNSTGSTLYQTTQISTELLGDRGYSYSYDEMGNIISITEGSRGTDNSLTGAVEKITYEYDDQNQLVRENNLYLGKTIVYTYDKGGNLTEKRIYPYTVLMTSEELSNSTATQTIAYTYENQWKDRLATYNGESITYDAIGNPLSYSGKTLAWTGRNLDSIMEGSTQISYRYDSSGLRTGKTVGNISSEYYYTDGLLAYEKRGNNELYYLYESDGTLAELQYVSGGVSVPYYPAVNSRGDVEALYNSAGVLEARYIYDSWGKVISVQNVSGSEITDTGHIGYVNPIRYRGYYYDAEVGL